MVFSVAAAKAMSLNVKGSLISDGWPRATQLENGNIVVANRYIKQAKFESGITILSPDGRTVLQQIDADDGGSGQRDHVHVTALTGGGFAVVWNELVGGSFKLFHRSFDADGTPAGPERDVFDDLTGYRTNQADVVSLANGGYAVVSPVNGGSIRRFDADGTPLGDTSAALGTGTSELSFDEIGRDFRATAPGFGNTVRFYTKNGIDTGDTVALQSGASNVTLSALGVNNSLAVYHFNGFIRGQVLDRNRALDGAAFDISSGSGAASDVRPDIAVLADGSVMVVWVVVGSGSPSYIEARRISKNGRPLGDIERITLDENEDVAEVHAVAMADGSFGVTWGARFGSVAAYEAFFQVFATDLTDGLIQGTRAGESLDGTAQDDVITGDSGADELVGKNGNDALHGQKGRDSIDAGNGDDFAFGGTGNDRIFGGTGDDDLFGGDGRDRIYGGDDNDVIGGGADDDKLFGGNNGDRLTGGAGNDVLKGGGGKDTLFGGSGTDRLLGGAGEDTLYSGTGGDTLFGGGGADVFVMIEDDGTATIADFQLGSDTLDLDDWFFGGSPDGETVLNNYATEVNGNTEILYNGDKAILVGITEDDWAVLAGDIVT